MDVLSNVLRVTNLVPDAQAARELVAPWTLASEPGERSVVHVIGRGRAWLHRPGCEPRRLEAGDVVLLPSGDAHTLSSEAQLREHDRPDAGALRALTEVQTPPRSADSAATTLLQTARYQSSREGQHPLLTLLPPVIHLPAERASADPRIGPLLQLLVHEAERHELGSERVVPTLMDALFVYLVRNWLHEQPAGTCGWLGALRDGQIGKALALIHERPQTPWTVEMLARSVAMSRAAFAKRFADLVGEPPLAYITRWRMDLAAKLLRESREPVARIASKVGYISETAFAKAFRRRRQLAPGAYRYQRRNAAPAASLATQ